MIVTGVPWRVYRGPSLSKVDGLSPGIMWYFRISVEWIEAKRYRNFIPQ